MLPATSCPRTNKPTIRKKKLEFSITNLGVQEIHSSRVNPDQDIIVLQFGLWHIDQKQSALLLVLLNDEGLHLAFSNFKFVAVQRLHSTLLKGHSTVGSTLAMPIRIVCAGF